MSKTAKLISLLCAAALAVLCAAPALALDEAAQAPQYLSCAEIPMYTKDDGYIGCGILIDQVTYVPLRAFTEAMLGQDCVCVWDQDSETATLETEGLALRLRPGDGYMSANGRCFYLGEQVYNINGSLMVPVRALARMFGVTVDWNETAWAIRLDTADMALPEDGETFYNVDDLYWLSRVIFSEAGNQPLEGMIGVGNVVLNRVNDPSGSFASTIYGVIFQYGQFDVVPAGYIYCAPSQAAIAAAKLCLEGCNTVGDAKWFLNPKTGNSTWFRTYKTFALSIADHDFYA